MSSTRTSSCSPALEASVPAGARRGVGQHRRSPPPSSPCSFPALERSGCAPNDSASLALGEALAVASKSLGRRVACLGSSDLTHYGSDYGFSPKGRGTSAEAWVRGSNDKRFIDAILALDGKEALSRAEAERSACSPGAAAAALAFALAAGASSATLLAYATSLDVRQDDSFVGYAAIAFHKEE